MIKTRILELSKKQINENTSIKIEYEILGKMQRQSIVFKVESKENSTEKNNTKKLIKRENSSILKVSENISPEVFEFREKAKKKGEKFPIGKKFEFLARIIPLKTVESIKELCMEFEIKI